MFLQIIAFCLALVSRGLASNLSQEVADEYQSSCEAGQCSHSGTFLLQKSTRSTRGKIAGAARGEHVTDLVIVENSSACSGRGWEAAGPSPITSASQSNKTAWLCVQRDPKAAFALAQIGFVLTQTSVDRPCVADPWTSQSSMVNVSVVSQSPGNKPQDGCAKLGSGWRLLQGHLNSVGPAACDLHMCAQTRRRTEDNAMSLVKRLSVFRVGNAQQTPCFNGGPGTSPQYVKIPGFHVESLIDDPLMMCLVRQKSEAEQPIFVQNDVTVRFPSVEFPVPVDRQESREHYFVLGPETSGTRLWTHLIASGRRLTDTYFENFQYDSETAVFHLSLPWGSSCGKDVPVYDDFGGDSFAYEQGPETAVPCTIPPHADRFNVDPLSVVQHYRQRGNRVRVVLVARDPRASFAGKMIGHCGDQYKGAAEQRKAFELMVATAQANLEESTTVCYEEMLEDPQYIQKKLDEMDIPRGDVPEIRDGNAKYDLGAVECTPDMLAYQTLCPNTALGREVSRVCL